MSNKDYSYPIKPFEDSVKLADAVHALGGNCTRVTAAEKMELKTGGNFTDLISTAVKFNLITSEKGLLNVSELFKKINNPLTPEEKIDLLRKAFLSLDLFNAIYNKFRNLKLPDNLKTILFRDFKIPEKKSSRVAKYFISGARYVELLNEDNTFVKLEKATMDNEIKDESEIIDKIILTKEKPIGKLFSITIKGPSGYLLGPMDISDVDQLDHATTSINSALKLIEKKLKENKINEDIQSSD